jgi:hypothetical protein
MGTIQIHPTSSPGFAACALYRSASARFGLAAPDRQQSSCPFRQENRESRQSKAKGLDPDQRQRQIERPPAGRSLSGTFMLRWPERRLAVLLRRGVLDLEGASWRLLVWTAVDGPWRHRACQNEVVVDLGQRRPSVERIIRIGMDTSKHQLSWRECPACSNRRYSGCCTTIRGPAPRLWG